MTRADIILEIRELDAEIKEKRIYNSPLQLRAYRRRRAKLHSMLNEHAFKEPVSSSQYRLAFGI